MSMLRRPHPLPASPVEGEVLPCSRGPMVPFEWSDTSPSTGEARRGWGRMVGAVVVAMMTLITPAFAQALPYHSDPHAREIPASPTAVPAIRFLTTADFPPFNYRDSSGTLIGFNVDLAQRICSEVNVACTLQAWPWDQASDALADNQGDALIAGLDMSDANGQNFDFSATYLALPGRFVTRADDVAAFDPTRLSGKTIAVRRGSAHEGFIKRYLPLAKPVPYGTEADALTAVETRQADVFFGDAMRASFWINENLDCCDFAGEPYFRPKLFGDGLAIAVPAGHDAIRHAIDLALVRLKENGTLDELYLRWFPVGFY